MITHLISCTEFVKLINSLETKQCTCAEEFDAKIAENYGKIIRYVNFISQKPELGMFVGNNKFFDEWEYSENKKIVYNKEFDISIDLTYDIYGLWDNIEDMCKFYKENIFKLTENALKIIGI